jgi:hypothetical protein
MAFLYHDSDLISTMKIRDGSMRITGKINAAADDKINIKLLQVF